MLHDQDINVVKSMYSTVKACVQHNSTYSPFFDSNIGVTQGDQCSSLLFLLFINDILTHFNQINGDLFSIDKLKLFILLFADDTFYLHIHPKLYSHYQTIYTIIAQHGI